ncbi:hypothetical protein OB2597_09879 [Pseudooceanicola batsensis HTCC2597]|uniref:Uncharacterized protein n=1 Tax=Pseudooceanicola batsensis (strain ATCC BAA-863 / DSM 15984 / KCTC 12145 / HTCC2597) TaxID=252305 RepID=A3TV98_PSEBH|nr:DUF6173 family protein [Pseudooceanicola batsensis]EAQ04444.1 hypothetical protein OB2597_09879 [Pseudooceanicola batsensis HTCC2597]
MTEDDISTSAEAHENSAMPRRHDALPEGERKLPDHVTTKPAKSKSPAEWAYERLILYIQNFEETLDADHEVAMGFVGGETGVLRIEGMGYFDPDIVTFYGKDASGSRTQLIQHVSQLSVTLRAMRKVSKQEAPRRIGFRLRRDLEKSTGADTGA